MRPPVGYSLRQVSRWWARYKETGLEGLMTDPPRPGKAAKLTAAAYDGLCEQMRAGQSGTRKDAQTYLAEQ